MSEMIVGLEGWMSSVLLVMQIGLLFSCRGGEADVHRTLLDSSIIVPESESVSALPTPNVRVKRFLETNQRYKERAFDELILDDALDAAAYMRLWHPPQRKWLQYALARFGRNDVMSRLVWRLGRVEPNSDIEITLEMLDESLTDSPDYEFSQSDMEKVRVASNKLQGQQAREYASRVVSHLRSAVVPRR